MRFISIILEDKRLVWFEKSNRYVRMEEPAFEVFTHLQELMEDNALGEWFSDKYELPLLEANTFITEVKQFIDAANQAKDHVSEFVLPDNFKTPTLDDIYSIKQYQFSGTNIVFEYGHQRIERMIHPLLAHLEVKLEEHSNSGHTFKLFKKEQLLYLFTDGKFIGQWLIGDSHYFRGKVLLECLNKAYKKEESEWLAMLHASAVSNGESTLLFAGNSGSGKSTSLAILLANGFKFLADDFVPLDAVGSMVKNSPVAISIKEGAYSLLTEKFPELKHAPVYDYESTGKRVRYLSPPFTSEVDYIGTKAKGIVFIDYRPGTQLELEKMSKHDAIQRLVTESWISPLYDNVEQFLNWFKNLPCYRLSYADNDSMVKSVQKLFNDGP